MNKKGLTLVELLAVIVVIAILGGIAVVSVNHVTEKGKQGVYENYENTLKGAAELYLLENTDKIPNEPTGANEFTTSPKITYDTLTTGLFMDKIKDPKGGKCDSSYVVVKRGKDISNNYNLIYYTCLICKNSDGTENYITSYKDKKYENTIYYGYACEK